MTKKKTFWTVKFVRERFYKHKLDKKMKNTNQKVKNKENSFVTDIFQNNIGENNFPAVNELF